MVRDDGIRDEELVRRMRTGDADAARRLFDRHRAALRARVRRDLPNVLRGKVAPSDVIQEAWLAAYLRLADFEDRGDASFARWIHGILQHKLLDEVRRLVEADKRDARRERTLRATDTRGGVAGREASPSTELMTAERAAMLRAQIGLLREPHRVVLHLVHDEGLTLVQTGVRMGRSAVAARKLYGRALAELTERLAGRGGTVA